MPGCAGKSPGRNRTEARSTEGDRRRGRALALTGRADRIGDRRCHPEIGSPPDRREVRDLAERRDVRLGLRRLRRERCRAQALEVIASGEPRLLSYGITDEQALGVGLPCGGEVDVFSSASIDRHRSAARGRSRRRARCSVQVIEGEGVGAARIGRAHPRRALEEHMPVAVHSENVRERSTRTPRSGRSLRAFGSPRRRWQPARLHDLEIQRLLEPVVRVELVVERVDLAIPGGAVEADRLRQRVVCLEPDRLRTRIRRAALQRTE